jgi:hypothetical protein
VAPVFGATCTPPIPLQFDVPETQDRAGLCSTCAHARVVASSRASTFFLCRLSETDPRFRRYPVLPVHFCEGFAPTKPVTNT